MRLDVDVVDRSGIDPIPQFDRYRRRRDEGDGAHDEHGLVLVGIEPDVDPIGDVVEPHQRWPRIRGPGADVTPRITIRGIRDTSQKVDQLGGSLQSLVVT